MFTGTVNTALKELLTNSINKTIKINRLKTLSYFTNAPQYREGSFTWTNTFSLNLNYADLISSISFSANFDDHGYVNINGKRITNDNCSWEDSCFSKYFRQTINNPFVNGNNTIFLSTTSAGIYSDSNGTRTSITITINYKDGL